MFHPPARIAYDGSDARRRFDDDVWELYHVAEDFSECHDLADAAPRASSPSCQALWWPEAERNQVLPLNNQPGRFGDRRFRRERYEYHAGISSLPETVAPNLRNRRFEILATLDVPADGPCDGVIVGHGGHSGGYALYVARPRLHYVEQPPRRADHDRLRRASSLPAGPVLAARDVHADRSVPGRPRALVRRRAGRRAATSR